MRTILALVVAGFGASLGGCAHYAVTDLETGETYYTRRVNPNLGGPAVVFRDAQTGDMVRLERWEVDTVPRQEFRRALDEDRRTAAR